MNFKLTLWKTLISIILGIIVFLYQFGYLKCDSPNGCPSAIQNYLIQSLIIIVIIYILWSFLQKTKK